MEDTLLHAEEAKVPQLLHMYISKAHALAEGPKGFVHILHGLPAEELLTILHRYVPNATFNFKL